MRLNVLIFLYLSVIVINAQDCLKKLDSVRVYQNSSPEKARFIAHEILLALDSGQCHVDTNPAKLYNNIGVLLWQINEKKRALEALTKGLREELKSKPNTHPDLLGLYYNLSTFYRETGQFEKVGDFLKNAQTIINKHYSDNNGQRAGLLYNQGVYHREFGNFKESISALKQGIVLSSGQNDSINIAMQIELGVTYRHFGKLDKSEEALLNAIEMAKNKHEILHLKAIDRLSALKIEKGDFSDSETYLLRNLEEKENRFNANNLLKLETYNNLGNLYYRVNDLKSAEKYIQAGLRENEQIKRVKPYLLNNLGTIYMRMGKLDAAEEYFKYCTASFQNLYGDINPDYASSLSNLAGLHAQRGETQKALGIYSRVLDMDRVVYGENHPNYATSLSKVAALYMQMDNLYIAGKLFNQVKSIRKNILGKYHPAYIQTMNDLGVYHLLEKDTIAALKSFDQALNSEIHHMHDVFPVLTNEQRRLYFNKTRQSIERFCALAFQDKYLDSPFARHAVNHFINTKGMLFYASEKMRRVIESSNDPRVKRTYDEWRDKKYTLAQAYLLTNEKREQQGLNIEELEKACFDLEKQLAQKFKMFTEEESGGMYTWKDISQVLSDQVAMLDIIQFRDYYAKIVDNNLELGFEDQSSYVGFIIKNDTIVPVKWDTHIDFKKALAIYKNTLEFGVRDTVSYKIFWKPLQSALSNIKKIYMSPDGVFHKINPAILFDVKNDKFVADEYDIINITSGKDLLDPSDKQIERTAEIFGNPEFSTTITNTQLAPLPGAEQEAKDVAQIRSAYNWSTNTYFTKEATESKIKKISNPAIMHIATHGFFRDDVDHKDPLHSSGLFLSREQDSRNDGVLTAYEAMNMLLDQTSLVVLAACETGLGTVENGEGVFGLQRAFLVAGTKNVLISLVKINDEAARRFMTLLYTEISKGVDVQQAFFNARKAYRQQDPNPYNWGAYILVTKG